MGDFQCRENWQGKGGFEQFVERLMGWFSGYGDMSEVLGLTGREVEVEGGGN